MLPKFKMAAGQLQIFLWTQKLQNLKSEIIQILLSYSTRYGDVQVIFLKVLLTFKMTAMEKISNFFVGAKTEQFKSVIIHIVQSHYTPSGNVHVILLKFKMATTNRLFK